MPFNGSGVYAPPSLPGSWNPAISGQSADPTDWNTLLADLSDALSLTITNDGQSTITANIPWGGFKITDLGNATLPDDAVNAAQVQNGVDYAADTGSATAYAIAPVPAVAAYAIGQRFRFKAANTSSSTTPTLAVSGLTAGLVKWPGAIAPSVGDIVQDSIVTVDVVGVSAGTPSFQLVTDAKTNSALMTTQGDMVVRGASAPVRIGIGTTGQVPVSNGTTWAWGTLTTGGITRMQVFTIAGGASQTYTPDPNMVTAIIEALGAGGGGGGIASPAGNISAAAAGGGAGSRSIKRIAVGDLTGTTTVNIGAAGAGATAGNNAGGNGGDTTVTTNTGGTTLCAGKGGTGGGGNAGTANSSSAAGTGGVAGTGDVTGTGDSGVAGGAPNFQVGIAFGGKGGSSPYGGGGSAAPALAGAVAGVAGTGYGAGGSGAAGYNGSGNGAGGAGTAGLVIIYEFCSA
jgi:hypothetical protein